VPPPPVSASASTAAAIAIPAAATTHYDRTLVNWKAGNRPSMGKLSSAKGQRDIICRIAFQYLSTKDKPKTCRATLSE
jgi:hypothetical protein